MRWPTPWPTAPGRRRSPPPPRRSARRARCPDVIPDPGLRDTCGQRLLRHREQPGGLGRDLAHGDRGRGVGVEALQIDAHIDAHDAAFPQDTLGRGNPVHDFLVDRDAETLGKAVESLERGVAPRWLRMKRSAALSSSSVDTPGRCPRTSSSVAATIAPARAMISISLDDLRVTISAAVRRCGSAAATAARSANGLRPSVPFLRCPPRTQSRGS
jgi:hypothetical protein